MKLTVTLEDIEGATAFDSRNCPIARALYRTTGERYDVGYGDVEQGGRCVMKLPAKAIRFASNFDDGLLVKPAVFILRPAAFTEEERTNG